MAKDKWIIDWKLAVSPDGKTIAFGGAMLGILDTDKDATNILLEMKYINDQTGH